MHILEAALFSNLSVQKRRIVGETENARAARKWIARPVTAFAITAGLFSMLELASPARTAELAAQDEMATMTISGLASVSGDRSKSP